MRKSEQSLTATDMVLLVVYGQGPLAEVTAGSRPIWLPSLVVSVSPYFSRRDLVGKRQNLLMPSLIALHSVSLNRPLDNQPFWLNSQFLGGPNFFILKTAWLISQFIG